MANENGNSSILATLQNIEEQTARLNQVAFVFQPWIEFNNLSNDGFRIAAVPLPVIPRLCLIPLVSIRPTHIESRINPTTNKVVPMPVAYTRPIYASYIDLLQRYGSFGLVLLESLACNLNQAQRTSDVFELIMKPFHDNGGVLEDLPAYFGEESPVAEQFEGTTVRVRTNAKDVLRKLALYDNIKAEEHDKFIEALPLLADSAIKSHRAALHSQNGVLSQSIREINKGNKAQFDDVDTFLKRQFPGYNSDSLLSHKSSNSDIGRLADMFEKIVAAAVTPQQKAVVAEAAKEVQRVAPELSGMIPPDTGTLSDADTGADLSSNQGVPLGQTNGFSDSLEADPPVDLEGNPLNLEKCLAIAKSGKQCKLNPDPTLVFPDYCGSHQQFAGELNAMQDIELEIETEPAAVAAAI